MNVDSVRHFYNYHFGMNRFIWNTYIATITDEQFTQDSPYSVGSVRNQILHLISVDTSWFCEMRGVEIPEWLKPEDYPDRASIRAYWDKLEQTQRDYLATLKDEMLPEHPFEGEDAVLSLVQVLLHVVNHGTDHRAQILRLLHDLGCETMPQDYVYYTYERPTL
jgi:uncharacterized damage-inducible protein DinB